MSTPPPPADADSALRVRAQYWVTRLAGGAIAEAELDALEAWLADDPRHARAFARERALWQDLGAVAAALAEPKPAPFPAFARRQLIRAVPLALAASLVAAMIGPSILLNLRADHRTVTGEVRAVALPDGSTAMLDSNSAISVDYDGRHRGVRLLAGRAWFDVRHGDRPFMVEALGGSTQDIGTGFEVRRDAGTVEVGVTQGAVLVRAPGAAGGPTLRAGERARYGSEGVERLASHSTARLAAWRNGELLFENQPVAAAIAEVARYRSAPVWTIGDFGDTAAISGMFLVNRTDEALRTIARMRGLRLTELPGGAIVIQPDENS